MSGPGYIGVEPDQKCELCGTITETRPYGPNDEEICFRCSQRDEASRETARKKMNKYIFGEGE